jgi:muramidase (phage lysozyme)
MLEQYLNNPNVRALLDAIAWGEGANYNTLYGGGTFSDFSKHPNRTIKAGRYTSTAAGRYQFLTSTWNGLKAQYGLPDFSPSSQDLGAIALLQQTGALALILNGDLAGAIARARGTWPSLPGGSQQTRTMGQQVAYYASKGGMPGATLDTIAQADPNMSDTSDGGGGGETGSATLGGGVGLLLVALAGVAAYYLLDL